MLEQLRTNLISNINSYAKDFCESSYTGYISDAFHEFADNNTSIYSYDQQEYYMNHIDECEAALADEFIDLGDWLRHHTLRDLICKAGVLGEYTAIVNSLYADESTIKQILILDNLIHLCSCGLIDPDTLTEEIVDEIINQDFENIDSIGSLIYEVLEA